MSPLKTNCSQFERIDLGFDSMFFSFLLWKPDAHCGSTQFSGIFHINCFVTQFHQFRIWHSWSLLILFHRFHFISNSQTSLLLLSGVPRGMFLLEMTHYDSRFKCIIFTWLQITLWISSKTLFPLFLRGKRFLTFLLGGTDRCFMSPTVKIFENGVYYPTFLLSRTIT